MSLFLVPLGVPTRRLAVLLVERGRQLSEAQFRYPLSPWLHLLGENSLQGRVLLHSLHLSPWAQAKLLNILGSGVRTKNLDAVRSI